MKKAPIALCVLFFAILTRMPAQVVSGQSFMNMDVDAKSSYVLGIYEGMQAASSLFSAKDAVESQVSFTKLYVLSPWYGETSSGKTVWQFEPGFAGAMISAMCIYIEEDSQRLNKPAIDAFRACFSKALDNAKAIRPELTTKH